MVRRRPSERQSSVCPTLNRACLLHALCSAQSIMLAATSTPQKTSSYWLFIRYALAAVSGASYERRLCRRREQIGGSQEHFCSSPSNLRVPISEGFRLMPPSWFLRFGTGQAGLG